MTESYYNEKPTMRSRTVWTEGLLGQMRSLFRKGRLTGNYGRASVIELEGLMRNHMREWIVGGRTLVIGSQG